MQVLQQLFLSLWQMIRMLLHPVFLIPLIICGLIFLKNYLDYKKGTYYQVTKLPYLAVLWDKGRYGEFLTYKYLKRWEEKGAKFLFNVYVPKENGETAEIDVLMLCPQGIFVFESKNYSGWIFGSENQKNWCQTLPTGRRRSHKEHFYNPIMQNRSHIKHLTAFLGEGTPMWSVIVFSDRCTLKDVRVNSRDIAVINRYNVAATVSDICGGTGAVLSEADIARIYEKLYPLTQVDESTKAQHVANIHSKLSPGPEESEMPIAEPAIPEEVVTEVAEPVQPRKCPKCNGDLVLRTAAKGANAGSQFYGCSNFPKCRYMEK